MTSLKKSIIEGPWEIVEDNENILIIKAKFDFPFNWLIDNTVKIEYLEEKATIEGPLAYVNKVIKAIEGKANTCTKRAARILGIVLIIAIVSLPILEDKGFFWEIKRMRHDNYLKNVKIIEIKPEEVLGNTIGNINRKYK